jgi:hypothetical protein
MGSEARKKIQKALLERQENIVIHRSPIPVEVLLAVDENHSMVVKAIKSGLTAHVYHVVYDDVHYCLKKKRDQIKVQNDDGQLSFLNEILCRKVIENHRENPVIDQGISKTYYANLHEGIILTGWVQGQHPKSFNRTMLKNTFKLLNALEAIGLFEWDLCSGNLLYHNNQLTMFDFGYMYQMNPKEGINSEAFSAPIFHMVERLETRSFFGYLLSLEEDEKLENYRVLKEEAVKAYKDKIVGLKEMKASEQVIDFYQKHVNQWMLALESSDALKHLFDRDAYRSYALDVHDDLTGQTCTSGTLKKIDYLIQVVRDDYEALDLLWFDEFDKHELLEIYEDRKIKAKKWQV